MDSSKETCVICLGSTAGQGQAFFTSECSHIFHLHCIASNLQHGDQKCPTCHATWQHNPFRAPIRSPPDSPNPNIFNDDEPLPSQSGPTSSWKPWSQTGLITVKGLPEYPALIHSEKADPFLVLVGIQAPPLSLDARAPLDLVAVLDVSRSMSGDKLRLLKQAVVFIVNNLCPTDRLSVITFSTSATRVTPLKKMTDDGKSETTQAVNSISIRSGTNIIAGLRMAVQVFDQRRQKNPVTSVILLSDGEDNQNGQGHTFLRALSRLPPCIRSRDSSIQNLSPDIDAIHVHTFGFGRDHDADALHAIADGSGGTFSYLESIEIIQDAFAQCIGGLLSVMAQQVEINIQSGSQGVIIKSIHSGRYQNVVDYKHGVVYIGDLYAEEQKQFLVYLLIPEEENALTTHVIKVKCSYKNPLSDENVVSETKMVEIWRPESEALSETDRQVCLEVDKERNRVLVAQGITEAQAMAERGQLERARSILARYSDTLLSSTSAHSREPSCESLVHEISEIKGRMSTRKQYESSGRAYTLSRRSAHMYQRASTQGILQIQPQSASGPTRRSSFSASSSRAMAYYTPTMKEMVTKSRVSRELNLQNCDDDGATEKKGNLPV